jgi:RsiW-degrading membrane proteinase PrsW (M82 family)
MVIELLPQDPEFYDLFGLVVFTFILAISIYSLKTAKPIPKWALIILIIIGIAGLIVDGAIVYSRYLT